MSDTLHPAIVSASRETDLPAFYSDWFVSRLREGWCEWKNTYSGTIRKISFDKTRVIVFWSKNRSQYLNNWMRWRRWDSKLFKMKTSA